jgi:hypothetical protein
MSSGLEHELIHLTLHVPKDMQVQKALVAIAMPVVVAATPRFSGCRCIWSWIWSVQAREMAEQQLVVQDVRQM